MKIDPIEVVNALRDYRENQICPECEGKGKVRHQDVFASWTEVCPVCKGNKTVEMKIKLDFEIVKD